MEMTAAEISETHSDLEILTLDELETRMKASASEERLALAKFLVLLAEVERREGYGTAGFDSLFDYVERKLGFPRCQTFLRSNAAKVVAAFPDVVDYIVRGWLTLSAVSLLKNKVFGPDGAPITAAEAEKLFEAASKLSTRRIQRLLRAQNAPVRRAPDGFRSCAPPIATVVTPAELALRPDADQLVSMTVDESGKKVFVSVTPGNAVLVTGVDPKNELVPIATTGQKEFVATVEGDDFETDLAEMAFLLGHDPNDYFGLIRRAVKREVRRLKKKKGLDPDEQILSAQAEARKAAEQETPPPAAAESNDDIMDDVVAEIATKLGRTKIPVALQGEVLRRAQYCCEIRDAKGKRCCSTYRCQFNHKTPVSLGGRTESKNLEVACQRCNLLEARRILGDEWVDQCIARNRAKREASSVRAHEQKGAPN